MGNGVGDEESERLAASKVELLKDGRIDEECAKDIIGAIDKLASFAESKRGIVDQRVVEPAAQLAKSSAKMAKKQRKNHGADAEIYFDDYTQATTQLPGSGKLISIRPPLPSSQH